MTIFKNNGNIFVYLQALRGFLKLTYYKAMVKKLIEYLKGSQHELRKVVWPTKKEVTRNTILVIVFSLGMAVFLGAVDYALTILVENILV